MPLFTIITASRDRAGELAQAVRSCLLQDLGDFEHLLVDDGSTSRAAQKVAREAGDRRIRVIRLEESRGPAGARNAALAEARGSLVAILDDDDTMLPGRLRASAEAFQADPACRLVAGAYEVLDAPGRLQATVRPPTDEAEIRRQLPLHNPFCHSTVALRTDAMRELGGYREILRYAHDYDLILRAAERGGVRCLRTPLAGYRFHAENISAGRSALQAAYASVARECAARRKKGEPEGVEELVAAIRASDPKEELPRDVRRAEARVHFQLGEWMFRDGRMAGARRHLLRSLRRQPFRPLGLGLLAASATPAWLRRGLAPFVRPLLARRYPRWR